MINFKITDVKANCVLLAFLVNNNAHAIITGAFIDAVNAIAKAQGHKWPVLFTRAQFNRFATTVKPLDLIDKLDKHFSARMPYYCFDVRDDVFSSGAELYRLPVLTNSFNREHLTSYVRLLWSGDCAYGVAYVRVYRAIERHLPLMLAYARCALDMDGLPDDVVMAFVRTIDLETYLFK